MRQKAVCFLVKDTEVLLLRIRYPDGHEIWNGVGGWVEDGERVEQGIAREVREEIGVDLKEEDLKRGYESKSEGFPITAFTVTRWEGESRCAEESIRELKWFKFDEVPFDQMIEGNIECLPKMLN